MGDYKDIENQLKYFWEKEPVKSTGEVLYTLGKYDLKGHERSYKAPLCLIIILSKLYYMNANIINTCFFYKVKFDLKGHGRLHRTPV